MWTGCGASKRALSVLWEVSGEIGWQELYPVRRVKILTESWLRILSIVTFKGKGSS